MVGYNYIRSVRERCRFNLFHWVKAEDAHQPTPKHKKTETTLFPVRVKQNKKEEGVKYKRERAKHDADVAFPQKR
jgi:hypothetical protein